MWWVFVNCRHIFNGTGIIQYKSFAFARRCVAFARHVWPISGLARWLATYDFNLVFKFILFHRASKIKIVLFLIRILHSPNRRESPRSGHALTSISVGQFLVLDLRSWIRVMRHQGHGTRKFFYSVRNCGLVGSWTVWFVINKGRICT